MFWWGCWEDRALAYIPRLKTGIVPHKKGFWRAATITPCFVSIRIITSLSCFSRKKKGFQVRTVGYLLFERGPSRTLYYRHRAEFYFGSILVAGGITVYMMFFFTLWDQNSFFQCIISKKRFFKSPCCLDFRYVVGIFRKTVK